MKFIVYCSRVFYSQTGEGNPVEVERESFRVEADRARIEENGNLLFLNGRWFPKIVAAFKRGHWDEFVPAASESGIELPYFHTPRTHQQGASFPSVEQFEPPLEMVENRPEKPLTEEEKRAVDAVLENLSQELGYFS